MIAFTGAVTPGPMLALVIGQVLAQGIRAAVFVLAGHALIEVFFILLFALGLSRFLANARVRGMLAFIGGLGLVWMGSDIILHVEMMTVAGTEEQALGWFGLVLAGVGVSLSNPYFTGWWATVGSGQVAALRLRSWNSYLQFFVGHELGDIVWYMFVSVVLLFGRRFLTDAIYRALLWGCGVTLILLAGIFLYLGARTLVLARRRDKTRISCDGIA